jgi:adenine phosphoribosyltransferase
LAAKPLDLKKLIKNFPDFPKQGVLFRDINPLISDGGALNYISEEFYRRFSAEKPTMIAGIESRGFIIATCIAIRFGVGVIMIRKAGKLPGKISRQSYQIEYGTAEMEIQQGSLLPGQNVIVADDLIATGGTALAAARLLREEGANISGFAFLIELSDLRGGAALRELGYNTQSLIEY